MSDRFEFFHEHAGYSYVPGVETASEGRVRCARALEAAELYAKNNGFHAVWDHEPEPDRSGIDHDGPLWCCRLIGFDDFEQDGQELASLWNIDLGPDGKPYGEDAEPYARVVRAELALQAMDEIENA